MFTKYIKAFIRHLRNEKRYSRHTLIAYESDLKQFQSHIQKDLLSANRDDVMCYMNSLLFERTLNASSVNRKLESIKAFYRYCTRHSLKVFLVPNSIQRLRQGRPGTSYVARHKFMPVIESINPYDNKRKLRDILIIEILYYTGCRASELINVRKRDIDWSRKTIKVLGKGRVERYLPVSDQLLDLMKLYLKRWKIRTGNRFVFLADKGKRIYGVYLWRMLRRYFKPNEIGMNVSAHTIRHSVATHLYQNGASMKNVKDFLGHKYYRSTDSYIHFDKETLRSIYDRCHPKGLKGRTR